MFSQPATATAATSLKGAESSLAAPGLHLNKSLQNLCNRDASEKSHSQKNIFYRTNPIPRTDTSSSTNIRVNLCSFLTQCSYPPDYNDFGMLGGRLARSRSN